MQIVGQLVLLIFLDYKQILGHVVAHLVEALWYKLEGRGFNSQWDHVDFWLI
jgi:hypothetical protein